MAAMKETPSEQTRVTRTSELVSMKTGAMLAYETLADSRAEIERTVLRKVLEKTIDSNTQLMALPLSLMYFLFYVTAYFLHEDISNVFALESTIRAQADTIFAHVETIDELWDQLSGPFIDTFFVQTDSKGRLLPMSLEERDRWGLWGRVATYNQIQGAVRFSSSRQSLDHYGVSPWTCSSSLTCDLCRSNRGFQPKVIPLTFNHDCGNWSLATHGIAPMPNASNASTRRLGLYRPELASLLQGGSADMSERFSFDLYPSSNRSVIKETLEYYRSRGWLDHLTEYLEIQFYIVNCELGRCRLEQVKMMMWFGQGGGIFFKRLVFPIFLELFSSVFSQLADGAFFVVWLLTSLFRLSLTWKAFLRGQLISYVKDPLNVFELFVVASGLGVCGVVGAFYYLARLCKDVLRPVRDLGWSINSSHEDLIDNLFATVTPWADRLENIRMVGNFFALVLMFRFFIGFGAQPRLRVVTKTLKVVTNDLFHFGLVFIPVLLAYMVSGTLMFGRTFYGYATVQAAVASIFRTMMESEFDWEDWTQEYYWYTGFWAWTFMFMCVLLMLNMVLAIILDVYNEVRSKAGAGSIEPIWRTVYKVAMRCFYGRKWIWEKIILAELETSEALQDRLINVKQIQAVFPTMPEAQLNIIVRECQQSMYKIADSHLDNQSLILATGSLLECVQNTSASMEKTIKEGDDPLNSWITPKVYTQQATKMLSPDRDMFMTSWAELKGSAQPHVVDPNQVNGSCGTGSSGNSAWRRGLYKMHEPPWLKEVKRSLSWQRRWLQHMEWELRQFEWELQLGHAAKYKKHLAAGGEFCAL